MSSLELVSLPVPEETKIFHKSSNIGSVATEQKQHKEELAALLKYLLDIAFFGCIIPFRFQKTVSERNYKVLGHIQKSLCGLLHFLVVIQMMAYLRQNIPEAKMLIQHVSLNIDVVSELSNIIYVIVSLKRLWINSADYTQVISFIHNRHLLPVGAYWVTKPWVLFAFYGLLVLKMGIWLLTGYNLIYPVANVSPSYLLRRLVAVGKFNFFLSTSLLASDAPTWESLTPWDWFLGILAGLGKYAGYFLYEFLNTLLLVCALKLWITNTQLLKNIKSSLNIGYDWPTIYGQFWSLKVFSLIVNKALGSQPVWYLVSHSTGFPLSIQSLILSDSIMLQFYIVNSLGFCLLFLFISAETWKKVPDARTCVTIESENGIIPKNQADEFVSCEGLGLCPENSFNLTQNFNASFVIAITNFLLITAVDIKYRRF